MADVSIEEPHGLTYEDRKEVENKLRLKAPVVYEIVRTEGEEELARPTASLWWSGIAAGLSIGFSVVAEGILHAKLPDAPWRPLVENFGYTMGFLFVILGRQQLFTENTMTAVLPVLASKSGAMFVSMLRLWGIVLAANMIGTALFGLALSSNLFFPEDMGQGFRAVATHLFEMPSWAMFTRGIVAGMLIATLVWLMPSSEGGEVLIIILVTYLIALGDLSHVIAGSVEAFLLLFDGTIGISEALFGFFLPTLAGNIIGGSALVAVIAYGQVRKELEADAS